MSIDPTHTPVFVSVAVIFVVVFVVPASFAIWAGSAHVLASPTTLEITHRAKHLLLYLPTQFQNGLQKTNHPALVYFGMFVSILVQLSPHLVVIPALHLIRVGPAYVSANLAIILLYGWLYVWPNLTNVLWVAVIAFLVFLVTYDFKAWISTIIWLMLAAYSTTLFFEDSFASRCIISAQENPIFFVSESMSKIQQAMDLKAHKRWNVIASPCNIRDADEVEVAMYLLG